MSFLSLPEEKGRGAGGRGGGGGCLGGSGRDGGGGGGALKDPGLTGLLIGWLLLLLNVFPKIDKILDLRLLSDPRISKVRPSCGGNLKF